MIRMSLPFRPALTPSSIPSVRGRSRRVVGLMAAIIVLSLADLIVTLSYLTSTGMIESNPIAASLIRRTQSPELLSIYKLGTVAVACGLLYVARHRPQSEFAAWCCFLILVGTGLAWVAWARAAADPVTLDFMRQAYADDWVRFD